jgi:hypothetical protein
VISEFEDAKRAGAGVTGLLRTVPFDLASAIVARDTDLDIATFSVTEDQLKRSEATELDCRSTMWPPPEPKTDSPISFAGFPEEIKKVSSHIDESEFRAFVNLTFVQDFTKRDILVLHVVDFAASLWIDCSAMAEMHRDCETNFGKEVCREAQR